MLRTREKICSLSDTRGEAAPSMRPRLWQEDEDRKGSVSNFLFVAPVSLLCLYFVDDSVIYFSACIPLYSLNGLNAVYIYSLVIARWCKKLLKMRQRSKNRRDEWNQV